jgi:alkanesulfonate monooxygenase SsuD/methylene tetrahydromethanopterin reductase-like flavin-dependent oxidoreductase (luciferase family)
MAPAAPDLGLTFASFSALGPGAGIVAARRAAAVGYRSFWVAETVGTEAFATLAAIGADQPGLDLGTGVLAAPLRTPPLTAMGAATLQAMHPDREVLLGVGSSSPVVVSRWHGAEWGDRPLARMREYLTLLRLCLSGERVDFEGDFWTVRGFRLGQPDCFGNSGLDLVARVSWVGTRRTGADYTLTRSGSW